MGGACTDLDAGGDTCIDFVGVACFGRTTANKSTLPLRGAVDVGGAKEPVSC